MTSLWDEAFGSRTQKASEGVIVVQGPGFVEGLGFRMVLDLGFEDLGFRRSW